MKRSKILSLILGVGMIGAVSVGITSTKAQEQTTGVQNVRVLTNRTTNQGYACVINGNGSLVLTNAKERSNRICFSWRNAINKRTSKWKNSCYSRGNWN